MLATTGAFEIQEWIAELTVLRPEDERTAYENARRKVEEEAGQP